MRPSSDLPILIVEDDQAIRESLDELLTLEGYSVALSENGKVALELLRSKAIPPALILLDLSMPVMDGEEFLEQFKKTLPELHSVPIFLMTAAGEKSIPK